MLIVAASEPVDHTIAYLGFAGLVIGHIVQIILSVLNRRRLTDVETSVSSVHEQIKSPNGATTGQIVESSAVKLNEIAYKASQAAEKAEISAKNVNQVLDVIGRHMSDGHGPDLTDDLPKPRSRGARGRPSKGSTGA